MRYRIGDDPTSGASATDDMLLLTVVISLVVGVVLIWLARLGRQMWLMAWSVGLVLASIAYMAWAALT
jgi:hypothetical protein